jgi:hypothetical protein
MPELCSRKPARGVTCSFTQTRIFASPASPLVDMRKPANRHTRKPEYRNTGKPRRFAHPAKRQHTNEPWAFTGHRLTDANDPSLRPVLSRLSNIPSLSASQMEGEERWMHLPFTMRTDFRISAHSRTRRKSRDHCRRSLRVCEWFRNVMRMDCERMGNAQPILPRARNGSRFPPLSDRPAFRGKQSGRFDRTRSGSNRDD